MLISDRAPSFQDLAARALVVAAAGCHGGSMSTRAARTLLSLPVVLAACAGSVKSHVGQVGASILLALALAGSATLATGCMAATAAEIARMDTHAYPGRSPAQVQHAVEVALKTQGFTIVDETGGRIKTAPKVLAFNASGSRYTATAVDASLGWVIDVTSTSDGARVHAEMRPSQGGRALQPTDVTASYAEGLYGDLYREIDSNLGVASRRVAPVSATPATLAAPVTTTAAAAPTSTTTTTSAATSGLSPATAGTTPPSAPEPTAASDGSQGFARPGGSLAGLLGYGFNDALQVGFGARGGYTFPNKLYIGGMLMYHLGSSQSYAAGGVSGSSHANVYYGGVEGGYEIAVASVVVRPYAGVGPAWVSVSSQSNLVGPVPVATANNTSDSASRMGFWFGGALLYPVSQDLALGGDARVLVVSDYNTVNLLLTGVYHL
jgi:hypothetical protein